MFGSPRVQDMAHEALDTCALQLYMKMSTEIQDQFWRAEEMAEERHQQHDEKQLRTERGLNDLDKIPSS